MKAISIKLPDLLCQDLVRYAQASANSQSDIVRSALAMYLKSKEVASSASCAARATRWAGMVDGPPDLSTNPEHLRGFGQ